MYISLIAGVLEIDIESINRNKRIINKEGVSKMGHDYLKINVILVKRIVSKGSGGYF